MVIPIFTSQLEKARESTDLANIRAAYAECSSAVLTGENSKDTNGVTISTSGDASKEVTLTQTKSGWIGDNGKEVAGIDIQGTTAKSTSPKGTKVVVTVTSSGTVTIADKTTTPSDHEG